MKQGLIRSFLILTVALSALVAQARDGDKGYQIESWEYLAEVSADNVWTVTETMRVNFLEQRHGIYRYIPRRYVRNRDLNGKAARFTYLDHIDGVDVQGETFVQSDEDDSQDNLLIRIGQEDVVLQGEHTYVIRYQLHYPDDRFAANDELVHTLLGPDCNTTIDRFTYRIHFAKPLPVGQTCMAYSGKWGEDENELNVKPNVGNSGISGTVTNIAPYQGITLQATLPEGFWEEPFSIGRGTNYLWFYGAVAFLIAALGLLILHRRPRPTMIIEYSAPEGISSAEVGVIIDNSADLSDLTSLVVWFASKGYIKIRELKDDDIELEVLKPLPDDAPDYQKKFWKVLFEKKDKVQLSKLGDCHSLITKALLSLSRTFRGERKLVGTHINTLLCILGFLCTGTGAIITSTCVEETSGLLAMFTLLLWLLPIIVLMLIRVLCSNYDMIWSWGKKFWQYLFIVGLCAADVLLFWLFFYNAPDNFLSLQHLLLIIVGGWVITLFSGRMQRDTAYRQEKMALLLGFREFIEKSELPMLKAQVDENPAYFFDVLPYAMVFGLTKKWTKKFRDIDMPIPTWYECKGTPDHFTGMMVADRLTHSVSSSIMPAIEVSSHDPNVGSSSSSGTSFVGGGGGGGGVGSW